MIHCHISLPFRVYSKRYTSFFAAVFQNYTSLIYFAVALNYTVSCYLFLPVSIFHWFYCLPSSYYLQHYTQSPTFSATRMLSKLLPYINDPFLTFPCHVLRNFYYFSYLVLSATHFPTHCSLDIISRRI